MARLKFLGQLPPMTVEQALIEDGPVVVGAVTVGVEVADPTHAYIMGLHREKTVNVSMLRQLREYFPAVESWTDYRVAEGRYETHKVGRIAKD